MNGPASDVFISYKAEDRKRLTPLVKALEDEGFDVWWDQHIGSGTDWREEIETHLDAAKVVIVVWSKKTIGPEGRFVRDEAGQAQEAGHYLPITVDKVRPPLGFREVQALDLSSWKGNRADPRFQVLADTIRHRLAGKEIGRKALVVGKSPVSRRGLIIGGGAATAAVAAGVIGWEFFMPTAANARRIAVLPFKNLSGDSNQSYFAEGVAEELRGALSRIGLEVIGGASSEAVKDLDTKTAAAKLGVGNLLSGSVRRSPQMVRIGAQLVDGSDGVERWSENYDRAPGDEIKIQTDIASSVAQALSVALGQSAKAALTLGGTSDAAAQDLYLRAKDLITKVGDGDSVHKALNLVDGAIARDPNFAEAYRLKASCLFALATSFPTGPADIAEKLPRAEVAARRALSIAPALGPAYVRLALIKSAQFDFADAVQNMRIGLQVAPHDAVVMSNAVIFMYQFGNPRKAAQLADEVIALDPLKGLNYAVRADALFCARDYAGAIAAARKNLEMDPKSYGVHRRIGDCLVLMNRPAQARAEYAQEPADDPLRQTGEAVIAARSHDMDEVERIVAHIRALFGDAASYQYAGVYAQSGDRDRAFTELENAIRSKDPGLQTLKVDPWIDPIRSDPRYGALLKRLNFPTWS